MKWNNKLSYQAILIVSGILLYSFGLNHDFTYLDDHVQVVENPFIKSLNFDAIKGIFSSYFVGMYQPVTTLFYSVTLSIFGMNPMAFHGLSLFFHITNCLLLFNLLKRFMNSEKLTFILSFMFLVHPMQVESVAWVSAFSNLLFSFFFLAAFLAYMQFKATQKLSYLLLCSLGFVLACLSKSAAVVFPIALMAFDYYHSQKLELKPILQKIPLLAISIIFGIVTILGRETAGHLSDLTKVFSGFDRFFLICNSILFYPFKFILPYSLSAFYPYPEIIDGTLPFAYYLSPLFLIASVVLLYVKRENKLLLFGALWFFITIALVLQFVPFGNQITTDRYIYLPMVGLLLILGSFLQKVKNQKLLYLGVAPILVFGVLSFQRISIWENDETLWTSVIETHPNVSQAYNNLGSYSLKKNKPQAAYGYFNKAIQLQPNYTDAYSNRGNIFSQAGNSEAALKDFSKAIQLRPHADAYFNRANEYSKLNRLNEAVSDYTKSIEIDVKADSYTNRAFTYLKMRKTELALSDAIKAIDLDPNSNQAYFILGLIQQNLGNKTEACSFFFKAMNMGNKNAEQAFKQTCR